MCSFSPAEGAGRQDFCGGPDAPHCPPSECRKPRWTAKALRGTNLWTPEQLTAWVALYDVPEEKIVFSPEKKIHLTVLNTER